MRQHRFTRDDLGHMLITSALLIVICCPLALAQTTPPPKAGDGAKDPTTSTVNSEAAAVRVDDAFVIGPEDVLVINVWKEPEISRTVTVRSDGKISLALVGDIQAKGTTPAELGMLLKHRLETYIANPVVTVIVQEIHSRKFSVLGSVSRPGSYAFAGGVMTVVDAIAVAGGFRDFAKQKSMYVIRQNPDGSQTRLAFNYKDFIKGKNPAQNVKLQPNDVVIVP